MHLNYLCTYVYNKVEPFPFQIALCLVGAASASLLGNLGYLGSPVIKSAYIGAPLAKAGGLYGAPYGYGAATAAPYGYAAPSPYGYAPATQYQSRDVYGNVAFGYAGPTSARKEVGNAYGGVTGSYQYIDGNGIPQTVNYVADALGFRATGTNLPVAPAVPVSPPLEPPVDTGVPPEPVTDTPEVAAAKAEFQAAFDAAEAAH